MLAAAGIDRQLFCDAFPSGTVLGEVTAKASQLTGLAAGTPVVLGGHDYLCGALPVGAFKPGVVLDVTGTWEIILASIPEPILTLDVQRLGVTVETHVAKDVFAIWGGSASSDMLEWYRTEYGEEARRKAQEEGGSDWEYLMADAESSPPGASGVMFLPHMSAVGCPVVDARSMGAFIGMSNFTHKGDLLRSIIEGLNFQVMDILSALQACAEINTDHLVAVGGGTRNAFWMQNKANVTGLPIEVPDVEEATPLGAAILAGIGIGLYDDEDEAYQRVYRSGKIYYPDRQLSSLYSDMFNIYQKIYPSLQQLHHQLYDRFRK
jgi:xylulokinase